MPKVLIQYTCICTHQAVHDCCIFPFLQVREAWQNYELDLISYQNKCRLIRGWDDLFNKLKEHINSVAAMKLSPYFKVGESVVLYTT